MTKCDFCLKSLPNDSYAGLNCSLRLAHEKEERIKACEDAIAKMTETIKPPKTYNFHVNH